MTQAPVSYNIVIVQPAGYKHSASFNEIAETLQHGLEELDLPVKLSNRIAPAARNIILGANLLSHTDIGPLPGDTIIYNFEQLSDDSIWVTPAFRALLQTYQVWDYSLRNIKYLQSLGCRYEPRLVPLGFVEQLNRIEKPAEQDIDVLFYGSFNERRQKALLDLRSRGVNVVPLMDAYGATRDAYIARAKIIVNIHYFDTKIFEIARVSYLLANKKAVVSECGPTTEITSELKGALKLVEYDEITEACLALLQDDDARCALEQSAYDVFSATKECDILKSTLADKDQIPMQHTTPDTISDQPENSILSASQSVPTSLNIGSGKNHRENCLNLDILDYWKPDVCADLADKNLIGTTHQTDRFGEVEIQREMFDEIICNDVIEHIPDLVSAMTNCLNLLKVGGKFNILVPYDLSYGAWQDPTHVRAFNENSWLYYTSWHWYLGWKEARFHVRKLDFNLNPVGQKLLQKGMEQEELLRTPRAVDSMFVILEKQLLTEKEKRTVEIASAR
ncbi:class I SAM-dependent methyltransferase [Tritonibacter scottomollicae]|uniref:Class I SAM-dependent methyltransferase n=2 Tax=Pseudomonadota TaxID=1224 RepID=A0ABZ0HK93_TRISK|nr:class I SAM-dependent methyltransferase [Tritonibacter scottomollicae]WOI34370.1 class I SAM-dependent methyltransferase [Tritonibacter scottomollicae]